MFKFKKLWIPITFVVGFLFIFNPKIGKADMDSTYNYAHYTIQVDSYQATEISQVYGFREVHVGEPTTNTTVFYKLDGSTTNIATEGWWILGGQPGFMTTNQKVYLQLAAGESPVTVRVLEIKK